jgi:hypothetical protein
MGRNARWLSHTVHLRYSPALTGEMSSPFVDVGRLNASVWLIICVPKAPQLSYRAKKIVCFMHVFSHFGHYTKSRDSRVFRALRTKREEDQWRRATVAIASLIQNVASFVYCLLATALSVRCALVGKRPIEPEACFSVRCGGSAGGLIDALIN